MPRRSSRDGKRTRAAQRAPRWSAAEASEAARMCAGNLAATEAPPVVTVMGYDVGAVLRAVLGFSVGAPQTRQFCRVFGTPAAYALLTPPLAAVLGPLAPAAVKAYLYACGVR